MKFLKSDQDAHPKLTAWLAEVLPQRARVPRTWDAFCRIAQLTEKEALRAITLDSGSPTLKLRTLGLGRRGRVENGRFEITKPDWVQLALDMVLRVENQLQDEPASALLEATILHELVHWGRFRKSGVGELEGEEYGLEFEREAYEKEIQRYWRVATETPLFVFPVTGQVGGGTAYWGHNIRNNGTKSHFGIDVYNAVGTPVHAAADGTVLGGNRFRSGAARLQETGNYGQMIDIDHHNGLVTRYAHLNTVELQPGDVRQGDRIGTLGASGTDYGKWLFDGQPGGQPPASATLPHLHFEVRRADGAAFGDFYATYDPAAFFSWMPDGSAARNTYAKALDPGIASGEFASASTTGVLAPPVPLTSRAIGAAYPNTTYGPTDPRGLRNNNPGNIKRTGDAWQGLVPEAEQGDTVFFQFIEMRWGVRAIARILQNYGRRGIQTLETISSTWAPSIDHNNPRVYAATLLQYGENVATSVAEVIDLNDANTLFGVCRGIIVAENGPVPATTVSDETVREGVSLA